MNMENEQKTEMPKKKATKAFVFAGCMTCGMIAAICFTLVGLSTTVGDLSQEISKTKADVILANRFDVDVLEDVQYKVYTRDLFRRD